MRIRWHWVAAFLLLWGLYRVEAQEIKVNEAKLREALSLPQVNVVWGFSFTDADEVKILGEAGGYARQIAAVKKQMRQRPNDASLLFQLGEIHEKAEQNKEAQKAYAQAVTLLRKQIANDANSPKLVRAKRRALLGNALHKQTKGNEAEAEKWLRAAVKLAPKEWSVWKDLGQFLSTQPYRYAYTQKQYALLKRIFTNPSEIILTKEKVGTFPIPSAQGIAKAQRLFVEALACSDRAVALAPYRSEVYLARFGVRTTIHTNETLLLVMHKTVHDDNILGAFLPPLQQPEVRQDLRNASRYGKTALEIGHPALSEWALSVLIAARQVAETQEEPLSPLEAFKAAWEAFPPDTRQTITHTIDRLRLLAAGNASQRPMATAIMGLLEFAAGRTEAATKSLKTAVSLLPNAMLLRNNLLALAVAEKDFAELERLLQTIPEKHQTTYHRVMLAKVYQEKNDLKAQQKFIDSALQHEPKSPLALLAAATLILKQGDAPNGTQALRYLTEAKTQIPETDKDLTNDYQRLRAVHHLLYGDKAVGVKMLEELDENADEEDSRYRDLLDSVENS